VCKCEVIPQASPKFSQAGSGDKGQMATHQRSALLRRMDEAAANNGGAQPRIPRVYKPAAAPKDPQARFMSMAELGSEVISLRSELKMAKTQFSMLSRFSRHSQRSCHEQDARSQVLEKKVVHNKDVTAAAQKQHAREMTTQAKALEHAKKHAASLNPRVKDLESLLLAAHTHIKILENQIQTEPSAFESIADDNRVLVE
jgi:hypothetical protein